MKAHAGFSKGQNGFCPCAVGKYLRVNHGRLLIGLLLSINVVMKTMLERHWIISQWLVRPVCHPPRPPPHHHHHHRRHRHHQQQLRHRQHRHHHHHQQLRHRQHRHHHHRHHHHHHHRRLRLNHGR